MYAQPLKDFLNPKAWIQDDVIEAYFSVIVKENETESNKIFLMNCAAASSI